jgi:hypothetical protein
MFVYVKSFPYLCIVYVNNDDGFDLSIGGRRGWTPTYLIYYISIKKFPTVKRRLEIRLLNSS